MKVAIVLMLLAALSWGALYFLGGYGSWDPNEQGRENRAKIHPGMSYREVFDDITGDPHKYRIVNLKKERVRGQEIETLVPSAEVKFDRARVDDHMQNNDLPHGFTCTFDYSARTAFTVIFDGEGKVTAVEDAMTMADLLKMPKD